MVSDEQLSPIGESSVPVPNRMLRRLKKAKTISDLCPGSETTLDSENAYSEDLGKRGAEEEDGMMRSDLEEGVTARKVLDFDSVPEFNLGIGDLGEKGVEGVSDLETRDEIRVSEMKEVVVEMRESDSVIGDLETREEIRVLETKDSEKEQPVLESDSEIEDLGEKGDDEISNMEEIGVEESKVAEKETPVSEKSVPASDSDLDDSDEGSEDEELYDLEMKEARKKRRVLGMSDSEEEETKGKGKAKKKSKKSVDFDELPVSSASMNMSKKEAEKEQPDFESDSVVGDLGEKGDDEISDLEDIGVSEAGKEQPVSDRSIPASEDSDEELYDLEMKEAGKKRRVLDMSDSEEEETKGKKKRSKKSVDTKRSKKSVDKSLDFDALPVSTASMNMSKKERREYLDQLRAENQRLLRETRDAAFEPVPLVRKPISSVLEKIRKRKEEISKQFLSRKKPKSVEVRHKHFREDASDDDIEEIVVEEKNDDTDMKFKSKQNSEEKDCVEESAGPSRNSDEPSYKTAECSPTPQDPPLRSQTTNSGDELLGKTTSSRPLEEVMTPSVVTMNLKRKPSPAPDNFDEEAEHIKENSDDETHDSSPGDPVRKFIDEAAEEEDDSDNDLLRFEDEDEEDDDEEDDDLRDMIVSQYKEDPTDKDRRNELHQKWLEQQDAAGTEKLLQKLKRGVQQDATSLSEDEDDDAGGEDRAEDADVEEVTKPEASEDEDEEDPSHANAMRINIKKIKEMIPLMFTDEDDVYVSSDDEEWEKKLVQQRLYKKMEQKTKTSSAIGLENSEEILRHIKKPEIRKKAKATSFKEKALMGINKNPAASKSSFLGRLTKSSVSEGSRKRGSNIVRGYIFERDDSNSKSSTSSPEEPSAPETIVQEKSRPKRAPAKFTASQSQERSGTLQETTIEEEKSTRQRTTLYELLKMSSKKTCFTSSETVISSTHTESIFAAFKLDKKQVRR